MRDMYIVNNILQLNSLVFSTGSSAGLSFLFGWERGLVVLGLEGVGGAGSWGLTFSLLGRSEGDDLIHSKTTIKHMKTVVATPWIYVLFLVGWSSSEASCRRLLWIDFFETVKLKGMCNVPYMVHCYIYSVYMYTFIIEYSLVLSLYNFNWRSSSSKSSSIYSLQFRHTFHSPRIDVTPFKLHCFPLRFRLLQVGRKRERPSDGLKIFIGVQWNGQRTPHITANFLRFDKCQHIWRINFYHRTVHLQLIGPKRFPHGQFP